MGLSLQNQNRSPGRSWFLRVEYNRLGLAVRNFRSELRDGMLQRDYNRPFLQPVIMDRLPITHRLKHECLSAYGNSSNQCPLFPFFILPQYVKGLCQSTYPMLFLYYEEVSFPISLQAKPVHYPVSETFLLFPFLIPVFFFFIFFFLSTQFFL